MSPLSQVLKVFLKNFEWITNKETNHDSLNMLSPRFLLIRAWGMWYRSASTSLLLILPVPWIQILVFSFSLMNENWVFLVFFSLSSYSRFLFTPTFINFACASKAKHDRKCWVSCFSLHWFVFILIHPKLNVVCRYHQYIPHGENINLNCQKKFSQVYFSFQFCIIHS